MRLSTTVRLTLFASWAASAQTYTISTIAGGGLPLNVPATSVSLVTSPTAVAVDSAGNVFLTDGNTILRVDAASGILTRVAGNDTHGPLGDNGPAINAGLFYPQGLAFDSAGSLYIADTLNSRVRKISNGIITTVAGNGMHNFGGDNGPATSAQLNSPTGIALDSAGNLYIADSNNGRIREVVNGVITTVAGNGIYGFSGDNGPAVNAALANPSGVAVDSAGNIYIADTDNNCVRKVTNGVITTVAGNGTAGFSGDNGPATSARLHGPVGVVVDSAGNVYVADLFNDRIREVSNGVITTSTVVGGPLDLAFDSAGNLYIVSDISIRKAADGVITTIAGNGAFSFSGDNGPAISSQLYGPARITLDAAGSLYFSDSGNQRIRKISNGVITTVAGNGILTISGNQIVGFSGDGGPATSAQLNDPEGVAIDSAGNLYIADSSNGRIRAVSSGVITTFAGNGAPFFGGDNGPANQAQLSEPLGIALDSAGDLYIADAGFNSRIRKVASGVMTTVAGNGTFGFGGDTGPATNASLYGSQGVAVDSAGNLYIADTQNNRIRMVTGGVITTIAGNGIAGFSGDNGPATSAQLNSPTDVAAGAAGDLYIADTANNRIRKISNGIITTVAGNGTPGFSGDNGLALSAQLGRPQSVAVDSSGNIYIADSANNRIRLLTPAAILTCLLSVSPPSLTARATGDSLTLTIQTSASCPWAIANLPSWITVSGSTSGMGQATINLVIAPNDGPFRSATISVAGLSVNIMQAAGVLPCTYSLSPGGQTFAAAGGSGTIAITAGTACSWSAATTSPWITFTTVTSGSSNANVSFQVAANTGDARSGSITIAGQTFTVEQASATIAGLANAGSMAQLASGGSWTTIMTLVNTAATPVQTRLNFFDNNGSPLNLPLSFPQTASTAGPLLASTIDRTLNPGAELVIQSTGPGNQSTQAGWAQLLATGAVGGFAVFRQAIGASLQDAEVPLENRNAAAYVLPFDNTNGSATGVALANISGQSVNAAVSIRDDTGAVLLSDSLSLPSMGHTSFNLADRYASATAQRRGTLVFTTPSPGQISVLGLLFNETGSFSTIPALAP